MEWMDALNKSNWWRFYLLFLLIFVSMHSGALLVKGETTWAWLDALIGVWSASMLGRYLYVSKNLQE